MVTFSSQELQVSDFLFFGQCLLPAETKLDFVLSSEWEAEYTSICVCSRTHVFIYFYICNIYLYFMLERRMHMKCFTLARTLPDVKSPCRTVPAFFSHHKPVHGLCIRCSCFSDPSQRQLADALGFVSQEEPAPMVQGRRSSLSGVCYLTMGLLVLLLGLVFASMYVYRYFFITQVGAIGKVCWLFGQGSQTNGFAL